MSSVRLTGSPMIAIHLIRSPHRQKGRGPNSCPAGTGSAVEYAPEKRGRMIVTGKSLPRGTFLKGVGATVALPFLDSMVPAFAAAPKAPVRLAFLYVPNGIDMKNWNVAQEGPLPAELPRILKPLE